MLNVAICTDCKNPIENKGNEVYLFKELICDTCNNKLINHKSCVDCYGLFKHFCIRRQTTPTYPTLYKFGCDGFFTPKEVDKEHNCFNCKFLRSLYCISNKKTISELGGIQENCSEYSPFPRLKMVHIQL